ncbi:NYN domain-containing protein [Cellulomonas sp. ACRRI]|uniref:NYN domain-containing protein n=1 Tax=Cellulomonas sp. ACRRI TaxID=2918188 RepID=UPI001EF1D0EA|nr:NYN domain-containing protein [Cellulomonas sp. ACRRI]MCG7287841.1 NYN domain-containing protein [Cellulomonas sp. ACRRI]
MKKRVVVFLDWQNVYMRARESFHSRDSPVADGQVDPVDLGHVLMRDHARRHPEDEFDLTEIRIYRGRPTQQHDPKGYAAFRRQEAAWRSNSKIRCTFTDLRYPQDWGEESCTDKPREKGIDVSLAVDLVTMCMEDRYDVAIVMSADYDLKPAISFVGRRTVSRGAPEVEVAAWKGDRGSKPLRIRLDGQPLYCIWLDRQSYWGVTDDRDYNRPADAPSKRGPRPGPYVPRL